VEWGIPDSSPIFMDNFNRFVNFFDVSLFILVKFIYRIFSKIALLHKKFKYLIFVLCSSDFDRYIDGLGCIDNDIRVCEGFNVH